ncbi:MAG: ParB/RepB/Spo0J family partition protein [Bacilli bacterium]|nr:ParB/RepB/Spo0J family partition protein [Bacilli bacterium]
MDLEKGVKLINIDDIIPNRFQPRLAFNENELKELSDSIKQHGVIQPLVLRQIGDKYEIIAGERRYKASTMAGLRQVPAVIMNVDDNKSAEIAVVENIQRKDLTAIEEAQSYKKLLDKGMTQEELATKLGIAQPTIANKIRLLALDEEVQEALLTNKISERHARSLLQLTDKTAQIGLLRRIIEQRLTVKQTDDAINKLLGKDLPVKEVTSKEDIYNIDVDKIKNETEDLFEKPKTVSFEDLMKKQSDIPQSTFTPSPSYNEPKEEIIMPTIEPAKSLDSDIPEILDFDSKLSDIQKVNPIEEFKTPEVENLNQSGASEPINPLSVPSNSIIEEFRQQQVKEEAVTSNSISTLADAIGAARGLKDTIASKGFKVNSEEFDFEDMYQIVIKIQKN